MKDHNIHSKAMLVHLNIRQWSARKSDKRAAQDVVSNHNATTTKASFYKPLVEGPELEAIRKIATRARDEHYRRTLPWSDNGPRILSTLGFMDYMAAMNALGDEYQAAVDAFAHSYPLMRQEAKRALGTLFVENDYPMVSDITGKFSWKIGVTALPRGDDFRCDLGDEEVQRIRSEIESNTTDTLQESLAEAFDRVAKVVEAFIDRLANPDTTFRNSLVSNARDLAEVLPSLNFAGDPRLAQITEDLRTKLCGYEPDDLRKDKAARRQAYEDAMAMHKDLINFFGGAQ